MTDPSTLDWFHGRITRDTAEKHLSKTSKKDGTYLLRDSTQHIGSYVLSVCKDKNVKVKFYNITFYLIDHFKMYLKILYNR